MKFLLVSLAYGLIFVLVEVLAKKLRPPSEVTRKLSHILAGTGAALLPFVLTFNEIMLLGLLFVPAVYISMRYNLFRSVHGVKRQTYGELYFPLAIAVCAFLFPDRLFFTYGVLVIGVSDALASLIGQKYGRKKRRVKAEKKTLAGSLAFFVSTLFIGVVLIFAFLQAPIVNTIIWSSILAAALTFIEAHAKKGLDNLYVPVAASGLMGFIVVFGLLGN
jgi:phytol kinase